MTEPIVFLDDLATYLNDPELLTKPDRAQKMLDRAHDACRSVIDPLPASAAYVVERVAGRGYVTTQSSRRQQQQDAGSPYGSGMGGIWLTDTDRSDLRRSSGGGGAFTIDMLPPDYVPPLPPYSSGWDDELTGYGS